MRRGRVTMVSCAVGAVALSGCGSSKDEASTTAASTSGAHKAANVAVIASTLSDYVDVQMDGVREVVKPNGGSVKIFNSNFDPQKLQAQCQDAVGSGRYNVLLVQVLDPPVGVPCVNAAKAAGIPVIASSNTIGTDPNALEPQVDGVVGGVYVTPESSAAETGELVKRACEGLDPCNVVAEIATPTDPLSNQGVNEIEQRVPNAKVVQKFASMYDTAKVVKALPDVLSAHPEANVYLALSDESALAAVPVVKDSEMAGKLKILGGGGTRAGIKAVKDGVIFGDRGHWPHQEGVLTGEMAQKAVDGQAIAPAGVDGLKLDTPAVIVAANADEFTPEWGPAPQ